MTASTPALDPPAGPLPKRAAPLVHGLSPAEVRELMSGIYARGDRLMVWFLAGHMALALALAFYHQTWLATFLLGGGAFVGFLILAWLLPRRFITRVFAGIAQQAFVALHIYQLYGQAEQHFWYFTAFTMMIVYQDWVCMWPGALLIIAQHIIFAGMHNAGLPVHFFPETYVGFTKLFYHFGIALVQVGICGYWAHLLREQTLRDAGQKAQLRRDQELAEEQLQRQRAILDNIPDAAWVKDTKGRYIAVNQACADFFRLPRTQVEGRLDADLLPPDLAATFRGDEEQVMATRKPIRTERQHLIAGRTLAFETILTPIFNAEGDPVATTGIARDITARVLDEEERRRLEAQMQHAQKLESLGVLAGGIAHDFNNLLVGILGNVGLLRLDVAPDTPLAETVDEIERAATRAADLTGQMLAYSGKGRFAVNRVNLAEVVREMTQLLAASISKKATMETVFADGLPEVEADVTQIRQVVMNLITNASDALEDRPGRIMISIRQVALEAGQLRPIQGQEPLPAGSYVLLEVTDTGVGMSRETQSRVFDPFFTTKFPGRGLGMAAVLGILRGHHGTITIESEPGRGTTFRVYLPAVAGPVRPAGNGAAAEAEEEAWRGGGVVLVVDDDPSVRALASRILERSGYTVRTAVDGQDGLNQVLAQQGEIALILLDMMMPRLNGREMLQEVRKVLPDLPVVFSSGYSEAETGGPSVNGESVAFLKKPYKPEELITIVGNMLKQRAGANLAGKPEPPARHP